MAIHFGKEKSLKVTQSPMKPLLRKIFFWDEPAQGAFFGLTLLIVLQRCFWLILVGVVLPVFVRATSIGTTLCGIVLFLFAVAAIYSLDEMRTALL